MNSEYHDQVNQPIIFKRDTTFDRASVPRSRRRHLDAAYRLLWR